MWDLEPEFRDSVDLRQCWFPGWHADIGGGCETSATEEQRAIDDASLAWMCDQVDGLVTFDVEAAALTIRQVKETAEWTAERTLRDPCSVMYSLSLGGSSILRTPGSYHNVLENEAVDPMVDYTTRERMHPSIQLRIESKRLNYYPPALDIQKSMTLATKPKWEFQDQSSTGNGARWVRRKVEAQSNIFGGTLPAQREIVIKEYVIRERPGKNNFEMKLLPKAQREKLAARNQKELNSQRGW